MLRRGVGAGLLGFLLLAAPVVGSPEAGDALALVQRSLLREGSHQEPASLQAFNAGSSAEVAVPAGSGMEFLRCSITGRSSAPDTYDIYLSDVAPAYRHVTGVPRELLRTEGGEGLPGADLQKMLSGQAPEDRRSIVDQAVDSLRRSAQAPADPQKAAEMAAAMAHEAAKAEALKARLEAEEARGSKKGRGRSPVAILGGRAKKARRKRGRQSQQASKSFDSLDRNGDGIVTRDEFQEEGEQEPEQEQEQKKQPEKEAEAKPEPTPAPVQDPGQEAKQWEQRAKDWEDGCSAEDKPVLLQALDTIRQEKAEAVLARLPAECAGPKLGGGAGQTVRYEELIPCMQALTNTSASCSICPVKFMISMAANCPKKCADFAQGCKGRDACRVRGADCLDCARPAALRLLHCAWSAAEAERRLSGLRLSEKNAEVFDDGLERLVGGPHALRRLQLQAWALQRLIVAWGIDPTGNDLLAAPMLEALGVKTEAELKDVPEESGESSSALLSAEDIAKYDADGSGSLDGEELSKALAGMAPTKTEEEGSKVDETKAEENKEAKGESAKSVWEAAKKAMEEAAKRKEEAKKKAEEDRKALQEAKKVLEEEARLRRVEETRRKAEEEAQRKADEQKRVRDEARRKVEEEEARKKAEEDAKRKAEEDARRKAEEEERRRVEEEERMIAEEQARKAAEEEAMLKAIEDAKRKAIEDEKAAAEAERQRILSDPKLKAQEDAWQEALAEDAKEDAGEGPEAEGAEAEPAEEETTKVAGEAAPLTAEEVPKQNAPEGASPTATGEEKVAGEALAMASENAKGQAAEGLNVVKVDATVEGGAMVKSEEAMEEMAEEETEAKAEEKARASFEEEARAKAAEETKAKAEEEARAKAEEEARAKAAEEAKAKAEEEAKAKVEEQARVKAEEEAKRKAEEEAQRKAEEDAKAKAEEAKKQAEEQARKAQEEATAAAAAKAAAETAAQQPGLAPASAAEPAGDSNEEEEVS